MVFALGLAGLVGCDGQEQPSRTRVVEVQTETETAATVASGTAQDEQNAQPHESRTGASPVSSSILDLNANLIDGSDKSLSDYRGQVLLIVNVASDCGYTRQYAGLESLHRKYADRGFAVLGFPSNDFGGQEPGSNEQILSFCQTKFDVSFPMFAKVNALGEEAHPLFQRLAAQPEPVGGPPRWNFTKFLVDRSGNIVARYDTRVEPDAAALVGDIERLLETPAGE